MTSTIISATEQIRSARSARVADYRSLRRHVPRAGEYVLPLIPSQRIRLFVTREARNYGERVACAFRRVWRSIPRRARREMLLLWSRQIPGLPTGPSIEVFDPCRGALACVDEQGYRIRIQEKFAAEATDEVLCFTIAHELAHVWQYAVQSWTLEADEMTCEIDADEIASEWLCDWEFELGHPMQVRGW